MKGAIFQDDLEIHDWEADEWSLRKHLLEALFHGGNILFGNATTDDG